MFIVSRPIRSGMKPQKITAKPHQVSHDLMKPHDLIRNNELAFSSNELAFLPRLTFKNQTTEFGIDLEAKFTMVQVFLLSSKIIQTENHQS